VLKFLFLLVILILAAIGALFGLSAHSTLAFDPQPKAIGAATPITVRVTNPHGVRHVKVTLEQNGTSTPQGEQASPPSRWMFWRRHEQPQSLSFTVRGVKEGKARILIEAESNDFRALADTAEAEVTVVLHPPAVSADGFQHYINQGGSEMVMFTPSGSWTEAGVRAGPNTFRSFPVPGNPAQRFALFAYEWNTPVDTAPAVFVKNLEGKEATAQFWFKVFPKKFRSPEFSIDDNFLNKVVNQIDPNGSGDLLARFLKINGEMRRANNKTLSDLRLKTEEKFLWSEPFLQLANSKVESSFADVRHYIYKGKQVDQQVHLGFDLAVGQHTPVVAANDGKVIWAAPLGIYGNCIVVDHGYGLQSIYGHLSELAVKEGQMVKRGEAMGKSGSTGLAGGDHLHYSMQVDGVEVNPIEWWDGHWITDHLRNRGSFLQTPTP
jgi:murein DD-endopeptidase MepM/ murein hydrolase activator NlpD